MKAFLVQEEKKRAYCRKLKGTSSHGILFADFTPTRGIASGHNLYTHKFLAVDAVPHEVLWSDIGKQCRKIMCEIFRGRVLRHKHSNAVRKLEGKELIQWSSGRNRHILCDRGRIVMRWYLGQRRV